jgi:hypothetical protein
MPFILTLDPPVALELADVRPMRVFVGSSTTIAGSFCCSLPSSYISIVFINSSEDSQRSRGVDKKSEWWSKHRAENLSGITIWNPMSIG